MDTGLIYLSLGRPTQQLDQSQPVMRFLIIFSFFQNYNFLDQRKLLLGGLTK